MRLVILILLIQINFILSGQVVTVLDQETGEPIVLATIASKDAQHFSITDEYGHADLASFVESDTLEIRGLGYTTEFRSLSELRKSAFVVQLFHTGLSLDNVIVTATRIRQESRDIPYQMATINNRDVALQNSQTAADLLGSSGKIFVQKSQQGGGSPMIRGFSSNRLLYTIDGVRMNTAIFRSGNLQNVISLDPLAIEKTDIFFGPSSVIYGSDAIGGVMSFQTLNPRLSSGLETEFSGQVFARYATANQEKTGHLHINIGGKKWAAITSVSGNDYGDLKMGKHGPDDYLRPFYVERKNNEDVILNNTDPLVQVPSGYQQLNLMQKIRFRPNDHWEIDYGLHISTTTDYSRYDRHIRYRRGEPRYGEWSYGPQKWSMNFLEMDHHSDRLLFDELTIRVAQQHFEESRRDRDINDFIRHVRIEKVDAYSANFDFLKKIDTTRKLFYGAEAVINQVTSIGIDENITTGIKVPGPARYPQANWSSLGAYLTYQQTLAEGLHWQSGIRYSLYQISADFDTTFYPFPFTTAKLDKGSLTGSTGLVYRPDPSFNITANFATGFRAPNVDDIGKVFDSEPGAVLIPNPDLQSEYAYNIELGVAKVFNEFFKLDLSAYYTLLDNAMVRRNYHLNGLDSIIYDGELSQVQAIQNAAQAEVYGLHAGVELRLSGGLILISNLNIQQGSEELDDATKSPTRHAAPTFGTTRITYSSDKFKIQLYAVYSDGIDFADLAQEEKGKTEIYALDDAGNPYSPAWYTLNFKGSYALSSALTINVGLENITSQRYRPYSSGIAAAGRNFILSLKANI